MDLSLPSRRRDAAAAKRFFQKALAAPGHPRPRVINVDGNPSYPNVVSELKREGKLGFRSFHGARRTIQGYETVHMIRKGQVRWLPKGDVLGLLLFLNEILGLSAK